MTSPVIRSQPSGVRWRRVERVLFSPQVAAVALSLTVLTFLGCMSLSIGCSEATKNNTDGTPVKVVSETPAPLIQEGDVRLAPGGEKDVYYPIPYGSTPNLDVDCWVNGNRMSSHVDDCVILEQRDTHFRIHNKNGTNARTLTWKARGLRCPSPGPVLPPTPEATATQPLVPARLSVPDPVPTTPVPYEATPK